MDERSNIGVLVDPVFEPNELLRIATFLDDNRYASFWYPDEKFFHDCYVGLTLVASHTRYLKLGPCVTDPYSRHPIFTAAAVGTLAKVAPGRVWLGIGAGGRGLDEIGVSQPKPAIALREAIQLIRRLLGGENVEFKGEIINLKERSLDFTPPKDIKIMVGSGHGSYVLQMAGANADGVLLANYAVPSLIETSIKQVVKGVKRAGRTLDELYLCSRVDVAVDTDSKAAAGAVAPRILSALRASYPDLNYFDVMPEIELSSKLISILKKKDYQSRRFYANPKNIMHLIPEVLTDSLSVTGTTRQVIDKLNAIKDMGIFDEIVVHIVPTLNQNYEQALKIFNYEVLPDILERKK